ncbi:hypothetical protein HK27_09945 [Acetobacter orientalis]|uniref:hypothetical protein n=1 Tax=Acetobacter orientalis TaxID=146474 RepID=UPI000A39A4DD|nr:hypothetical protein [Acetobacter orientalis]OUJ15317.1 hypothetical protein HK27_09945 [Acetobacter orientalis]
MSSTVLDELVIRLGLDTGPMQATAQKALGTLDQLEQKNTALNKSLIQTGKTATASLSTMRREALGLLGLVSGGRGLGAVLQTLAPNAKHPLKKALALKTFAQGLNKQHPPQRQSAGAKRLPAFYTQNFAQSLTRTTALAPVFTKQDPYHTAKPAQQHIMLRLYSGPVLAKKIQTGRGSVKESSFSKNLFFPKNTPALHFVPKQAGHFSPHHFSGRGSQFAVPPSPTIGVPGGQRSSTPTPARLKVGRAVPRSLHQNSLSGHFPFAEAKQSNVQTPLAGWYSQKGQHTLRTRSLGRMGRVAPRAVGQASGFAMASGLPTQAHRGGLHKQGVALPPPMPVPAAQLLTFATLPTPQHAATPSSVAAQTTYIGPVTISVPSGNSQAIAEALRAMGAHTNHTLASLATRGAV